MISAPFIVALLGCIVIFAFAGFVFAIGKYNYLLSLRGRITNGMLQMDLELRKQSAELRVLGSSLPRGGAGSSNEMSGIFDRAEKSSHKAAAGRLCDANLGELALADRLMASCWNALATAGTDEEATIARNRLGSNAEMRRQLDSLITHYNRKISMLSGRWAAKVFGFENLTGAAFVARSTDSSDHGL